MQVPRFSVLGVEVHALTRATAIQAVRAWVTDRSKVYLIFCTVSSVLSSRDDPRVREAFDGASLVTPDGMPLVWLGRIAGLRPERVYGPDFMLDLMTATGGQLRHYFFGGAPGVANEMSRRLRRRFPDLVVVGTQSPSFGLDPATPDRDQLRLINEAAPDIVWVGLGHPKQELWMLHNREHLNAAVLMGVGAAFDFHSGAAKEAPAWMKRTGLQWVQRLARDPKRLWRRYIIGNTRFVLLLAWQALRSRLTAIRLSRR